jgi:sodium/hydrogen exchanger 8
MSFSAEYVDPPFKDDEFLGWSKKAFASDEHVVLSEYLLIFTIVLVGSLILQYYVGHVQKLCKDIPEAAATLLLGMVVGLVIKICSSSEPSSSLTVVDDGHSTSGGEGHVTSFDVRLLGFSPEIFFFGFLPPIIFNSGYHLKRKLFFSNFGAIFSLAILGTCFSLLLFAAGLYFLCYWGFIEDVKSFSFVELIAFGALISSTDPVSMLACFSSLKVDPMLFYLVFGESVLNDAIAITVFKVASKYVGYRMTQLDILYCILQIFVCFFLSSFLGYLMGILTAFLFKFIMIRNNAIVSVSIFIATVYIPYFLSETLQLSGIVTIFFSGISARRYTSKNISHESRCYASFLFQMLTNLADTACFMLLGMSVFSQSYSSFGISISVFSTLLCYLSRACHVYPLLSMVNLIRHWKNEISNTEDQSEKPRSTPHQIISTNTMHMVFMSGLRGAVAFSLAQVCLLPSITL